MCLCEDITLGGACEEINKAFHFRKIRVMKWCLVTDAINAGADTAVLGCLIPVSGCKSARAAPAQALLSAQAGLGLVVRLEQQLGCFVLVQLW